jgi:hypothetical protein
MDAIQKDVDSEVQEESLTRQQSEIERIAEKVHDYHETEGTFSEEEQVSEEQLFDASVPLVKKGESWYATAKVNGEAVEVELSTRKIPPQTKDFKRPQNANESWSSMRPN